jgi:hypothetical protein
VSSYTVVRGPDGVVLGALRDDGAFVRPDAREYQVFLVWNAAQLIPDDLLARVPVGWAGWPAYWSSQESDLATLRDQAVQAVLDINAYLLTADVATNVQVRAEVKAIDQRQRVIIKALGRLLQMVWGK